MTEQERNLVEIGKSSFRMALVGFVLGGLTGTVITFFSMVNR